jgi:hypothetical protein
MIVLGAVALPAAIVCVNVTNLLLARGVRRRAELRRGALGRAAADWSASFLRRAPLAVLGVCSGWQSRCSGFAR